jgi:hypothetical protein
VGQTCKGKIRNSKSELLTRIKILGKTRRVREVEEDKKCSQKSGLENLKERNHSEAVLLGKEIMFKLILDKSGRTTWAGVVWLRTGTSQRLF